MTKLLYIEGSPRKERSHANAAANAFIETYAAEHPDDEVETLDLWNIEMPPFDGFTNDAKYRILHGQEHTPEEAEAWEAVTALFERFKNADKYLFSVPMWNFGVPYRLKHFIDVITQPTLAFRFTPEEGYVGLVTNRPAAVIYARGGEYSSGPEVQGMDFQKPYMEFWLQFIGFTEIQSVLVEPTLAPPDVVTGARDSAVEQARELARQF